MSVRPRVIGVLQMVSESILTVVCVEFQLPKNTVHYTSVFLKKNTLVCGANTSYPTYIRYDVSYGGPRLYLL
jgi:hypothetical protein